MRAPGHVNGVNLISSFDNINIAIPLFSTDAVPALDRHSIP